MERSRKPRPDWGPIERDYRAGILSIREIGKIHGITDTAIRKKAKTVGWARDLTEKVMEEARTGLVRTEVRTESPQTERDIVVSAGAMIIQVVREHRRDISSARAIAKVLMDQLLEVAMKRRHYEDAIDKETKDDESRVRHNQMMRAVSLPVHTSALLNLSNVLKSLNGLERQAFNLGSEVDDQDDSLTRVLRHIAAHGQRLPIKE